MHLNATRFTLNSAVKTTPLRQEAMQMVHLLYYKKSFPGIFHTHPLTRKNGSGF